MIALLARFLISPAGMVVGCVILALGLGTGIYAKGRIDGAQKERGKWHVLQAQLVEERNAALMRANEADTRAAEKDIELDRLNRERVDATPRDDRPAIDRDAARRLRALR